MKKGPHSSFDRAGAKMLGGSLTSNDKFKGPLFARKKPRNYKLYFYVLALMAGTIFLWENGRRHYPEIKTAATQFFDARRLASVKQ